MTELVPSLDPSNSVNRLTAGEAADEIWLEVARKEAMQATPRLPAPATPGRAAARRAIPVHTLPSLLNLDGANFIEAAYRTILGREADEEGLAHLAEELARGTPKIDLLGQMQASREARATGRTLPGLSKRYLARRLYRVPVVGPGVRLTAAVLRRTGVSRALLGSRPKFALATDIGTAMTLGQQSHDELLDQVANLSAQLAALQDRMQDRLNQQQSAIDGATRRLPALQSIVDTVARRVPALQEASQLALAARGEQARQLEAATRRLADLEDSLGNAVLGLADTVATQDRKAAAQAGESANLAARIAGADAKLDRIEAGIIGRIAAAGDEFARGLAAVEEKIDVGAMTSRIDEAGHGLRQDLGGRVAQAEDAVAHVQKEVFEHQRRLDLVLEAVRRMGAAAPAMPHDHSLDPLYVTFEDRFRGSRSDIKQRQRFYLPVLAESDAGQPDRPVVDIGCGRGEFLQLLQEEGLTARGVDTNEAMVKACGEVGLEAVAADALDYLAGLPEASLGAVTGFHIIEHIPFATLVRLLDEALRVLAPGGVVIFETPNPANVLTASRWFWLDPTHRHPLPSEMVAMIAEARGYVRTSIVELHPTGRQFEGADPVLLKQLNALFHGPQDYALLARKP